MKLQRLKVEGLFGLFDYDISFDNPDNLTIITGPNGYGKTMLLKIVSNLYRNNKTFFDIIKFNRIQLSFDGGGNVLITKDEHGNSFFDPAISDYQLQYLLSSGVYFISDQRLLKFVTRQKDWEDSKLVDVIAQHSQETKKILSDSLSSYHSISQELDRTFPKRLLSEVERVDKTEFIHRFSQLKSKQESLKKYNLIDTVQEIPEYTEMDAKVLMVYLKDSEIKIAVFDELVQKLDTFSTILNERRFAFKSIRIDREKGFYFQTDNGNILQLTDLSSGEQHEVVILFELIFKTQPGTLVLIDEPELSLHVTWQRAFIADLLEIMKFQKMQVIVATHSPQIINDRWDLVYNLEKQPA